MTLVELLPLVRDVGAVGLLALLAVRLVPALLARLDYLGGGIAALATQWGVVLPPPPPPIPPLWKLLGDTPVKRSLSLLALVAIVASAFVFNGCAAGDAAAMAGKRSICAFGDGVATATRIWCGEPTMNPGDPAAPAAAANVQRVRVEVVAVPQATAAPMPAPEPTAFRFTDPSEGTPVACEGDSCRVADPVSRWAPPPRDTSDWQWIPHRSR